MTTLPTQNKTAMRSSTTLFGHPVGLFLLFMVEMWERFSYYGMRGLLTLYLISVLAAHQIKPGTYTNELRITEVGEVTGQTAAGVQAAEEAKISQSFDLVLGVDQVIDAKDQVEPRRSGTPSLVIERMAQIKDDAEQGKLKWIVPEDARNLKPLVIEGKSGNAESFEPKQLRLVLRNPTDKPIKAKIGVVRPTDKDAHTYFTVNKDPGKFQIEIKPDSARKADEKPTQIVIAANTHDSGRNWTQKSASMLYGWYTGLAYLLPIIGGLLADKLIGTHRSMLIGGILISIGHVILGLSGLGELAQSKAGMSLFMMGLAVIVVGTGYFKPTVSVMVGQLYAPDDPRRDGAFTIFYMGINLGAFICAFICGTLGELYGWHWGFGSAAVGMLLGLLLYVGGKPIYLKGIGEAPKATGTAMATALLIGGLGLSACFAGIYHAGVFEKLQELVEKLQENHLLSYGLILALLACLGAWIKWFLAANRREDRGPIVTILIFMLFNSFFWIAFEQAGSSLNVFTQQNTIRTVGSFEIPATWFQSVNAGLIFILAPFFAWLWTQLGKRKMNPSQPVKIALGLIFLGLGYVFMVIAGRLTFTSAAPVSMVFILVTYFWHTVGELCLSPTGLSYVTRAAPVRYVSLLMGIWFISSFIANLGGGIIASKVKDVEQGIIKLPWNIGGQADFFMLFVVTSVGAGVVILGLTPLLKSMMRPEQR